MEYAIGVVVLAAAAFLIWRELTRKPTEADGFKGGGRAGNGKDLQDR